MPRITINGQDCEFEGKPSILDVALAHDIEIPHYCYHEGLSVVASCRICLAEVWAPNPRNDNALEPIPRLLPTCQTPAGEGQVVRTDSPKALANQKSVMEYLLINHPLDCPICDQAGECSLQDYSYEYGRSASRFEEDKIKQPKKDLGPHVYLYSDRCIMCSRCVRFTREVTGTNELCVTGRGADEQIDLFPGVALDNELSGNVVDICPVGALLDKDFLFAQRVWLLTSTPSIDGITASGDNIWIEHNEGRIHRVTPRKNMAVNKWWITDEIRHGWRFVHGDDRLETCRRKQHGETIETSWDSALEETDEILGEARRSGQRIALLASPMLTCEEAWALGRLVREHAADPDAVILGVGPVPVDGEDRVYPPGSAPDAANAYVVRAEKAPNARGVRRVLAALADGRAPLEHDDFVAALGEADVVVLTGNFPSEWATKDLVKAIGRSRVILLDTLETPLTGKAEVVLASATWAEKSGTFENAEGRLQAFEQAIPPVGAARAEGPFVIDLLRRAHARGELGPEVADLAAARRFNAATVRGLMAGSHPDLEVFLREVHVPGPREVIESDMEIVEL